MTGIANIKKGDEVVLLGFTGIRLATMTVSAADKKTITIDSKKGELVFDRKTGKQTNTAEGKEKYANKIVHPDDAPEQKKPIPKKDKKDDKKKSEDKKVDKKKVESDEDEDDEEVEEEKPAPRNKKKDKKEDKKKVEDDEEEYEEV